MALRLQTPTGTVRVPMWARPILTQLQTDFDGVPLAAWTPKSTQTRDQGVTYQVAEVNGEPRVITGHCDPTYTPDRIEVWFCQWFAMCTREAVTLVNHPIIGDVPTCAECAAIAKS